MGIFDGVDSLSSGQSFRDEGEQFYAGGITIDGEVVGEVDLELVGIFESLWRRFLSGTGGFCVCERKAEQEDWK